MILETDRWNLTKNAETGQEKQESDSDTFESPHANEAAGTASLCEKINESLNIGGLAECMLSNNPRVGKKSLLTKGEVK